MTVLYKLIFDFSEYYAISGLYFIMIGGVTPGTAGFVLLVLSTAAACSVRRFLPDKRFCLPVCFLIPLFYLCFRPSLWQLIQLAPAMAYFIWVELSGRLYTSADDFAYNFSRSLWLLLLLLPPALFVSGKWVEAMVQVLPYIILMLSLGVCLLRILRSKKSGSLRQSLIMLAFLLVCALFCVFGLPGLLAEGIGLSWRYFFKYVLEMVTMAAGLIVFAAVVVIYQIFRLVSFKGLDDSLLENLENPMGDDLKEALSETSTLSDPRGLKISLIILGSLAAAFVIFLILRAMAGSRFKSSAPASTEERSPDYIPTVKHFRAGFIRPNDPRLAVRFYLQKLLKDCNRRGAGVTPDMTVEEISLRCSAFYPQELFTEFMELYSPARYSELTGVSRKDAERAEALWKKLKRSE